MPRVMLYLANSGTCTGLFPLNKWLHVDRGQRHIQEYPLHSHHQRSLSPHSHSDDWKRPKRKISLNYTAIVKKTREIIYLNPVSLRLFLGWFYSLLFSGLDLVTLRATYTCYILVFFRDISGHFMACRPYPALSAFLSRPCEVNGIFQCKRKSIYAILPIDYIWTHVCTCRWEHPMLLALKQ